MVVFVIPNMTRENAPAITQNVLKELLSLGCTVYLDNAMGESFSHIENIVFIPADTAAKMCDVIIAVGGDGSLIYAAQYAVVNKKPLLGVNAGNLAFMAGLEGNETHLLNRLIDGNYNIDKRILLSVSLINKDGKEEHSSYCLNDAVVLRGGNLHLVRLTLYKNGEKFNEYCADGLIIATPTGSTAYSLSAGGPIVEPAVEGIVITPICNHTMMSRSVVLRDDSEIIIELPFLGTGALLSCDSLEAVPVTQGSKIKIKKADVTCDLIKIKENTFMDVLLDKFSEKTI
ncbi:MAG: NAD(+)/NADH kinase [Clostridiales bacterium]|nr:NAD(+)/NADH kinase [Clostridiales bacterium]